MYYEANVMAEEVRNINRQMEWDAEVGRTEEESIKPLIHDSLGEVYDNLSIYTREVNQMANQIRLEADDLEGDLAEELFYQMMDAADKLREAADILRKTRRFIEANYEV